MTCARSTTWRAVLSSPTRPGRAHRLKETRAVGQHGHGKAIHMAPTLQQNRGVRRAGAVVKTTMLRTVGEPLHLHPTQSDSVQQRFLREIGDAFGATKPVTFVPRNGVLLGPFLGVHLGVAKGHATLNTGRPFLYADYTWLRVTWRGLGQGHFWGHSGTLGQGVGKTHVSTRSKAQILYADYTWLRVFKWGRAMATNIAGLKRRFYMQTTCGCVSYFGPLQGLSFRMSILRSFFVAFHATIFACRFAMEGGARGHGIFVYRCILFSGFRPRREATELMMLRGPATRPQSVLRDVSALGGRTPNRGSALGGRKPNSWCCQDPRRALRARSERFPPP